MAKKEIVGWGDKALEDMTFQDLLDKGVIDISEVDDVVVCKQEELVDVSFILYEWDIKTGDLGDYAVCRVKTHNGTRVFADGGVGIQEQLERYKNKLIEEPNALLYFHHGLRASHYSKELEGEDGKAKTINAVTYYFDNRPRD